MLLHLCLSPMKTLTRLLALTGLVFVASAAHAQPDIFGYSGGVPAATLTLSTNDGTVQLGDVANGWWSATYTNTPDNSNWFVGTFDGGADWLNDFFVFNLVGQLQQGQVVTGASISISDPSGPYGGDSGTPPFNYSLWDVTTPIATLEYTSGTNAAIYNDLGSGVEYGSTAYGGDAYSVSLGLDAAAVTAINAAANSDSGNFAIGGTLSASAAPDAASTAGLLGLSGAALLGAAGFRRRRA